MPLEALAIAPKHKQGKRKVVLAVSAHNMLGSRGYRDFGDYNLANNSRDLQLLELRNLIEGDRGLSEGSSRIFPDSDTDSAEDYSDARSQLDDHHALEARYGRRQILYLSEPRPGEALNDAFGLAFECKACPSPPTTSCFCMSCIQHFLYFHESVLAESSEQAQFRLGAGGTCEGMFVVNLQPVSHQPGDRRLCQDAA